MAHVHTHIAAPPAATDLTSRIAGIVLSPRETLARVAADPRPWGVLVLTAAVGAACQGAFLATEVGQLAWVDEVVRQSESFGVEVGDAQYGALQRMSAYAPYFGAARMLFGLPLVVLLVSAVLYRVFTPRSGHRATFRQVFAVVAHCSVIVLVQQLVVTPLSYSRESLTSPVNLSILFPMLSEGSFLARLLGTVDLFIVWWTLLLAIGMSVLFRRPAPPLARALFAVYGAVAVAIAAVTAVLGF